MYKTIITIELAGDYSEEVNDQTGGDIMADNEKIVDKVKEILNSRQLFVTLLDKKTPAKAGVRGSTFRVEISG